MLSLEDARASFVGFLNGVVMSWILNGDTSKRFRLYTRGNVSEVFPDPITPLNASTGFLSNFEAGYRKAFVDTGVWDEDIYDDEVPFALLGCIGGYVYINMSYLRLFAVRVPGYTPELLDQSYGVRSEDYPYANERESWHESRVHTERVSEWIQTDVFDVDSLDDLDLERKAVLEVRAKRPDLTKLTDQELVARIRSFNPELTQLFRSHAMTALKAGFALGGVVAACTDAGHPELAVTIAGGVGDVDSTGPAMLTARAAELVRTSAVLTREFDRGLPGLIDRIRSIGSDAGEVTEVIGTLLADWDFRGPGEWELRCPTWGTLPELVLAHIDRLRHLEGGADPSAKMALTDDARVAASNSVLMELTSSDDREKFASVTRAARLWVRARERSRTTGAMLLHEQRLAALELGRRGAEAGALQSDAQVFMLLADELDRYVDDPSVYTKVVAERESTYLSLYNIVPPFMVDGFPPDHSEWEKRSSNVDPATPIDYQTKEVWGTGVSPGVIQGRVRIVQGPTETGDLEAGEVLVTRVTDPSWTPLFLFASAVVTEVGGMFSHGAIVCRELGIPCVVGAENVVNLIRDGALVEVDGSLGVVRVLAK